MLAIFASVIKIGNDLTFNEFPLLLAPMEDVSDPPFRAVCRAFGADLGFSEFISSQSLVKGAIHARRKLDIFEAERPVGIQLYGGDEDSLALAAAIVEATNPSLLDINFGCPVKGVVGKGAGAGVLRDVGLMVRLTDACVRATTLPVTVKTRLGWDEGSKNIVEVAERLQDTGIRALTIHGRTRSQLYKGEADWSLIAAVKNNPRMQIPIFGNGDIDSAEKAVEYTNRYGVDGIMIGRAAIGYPWIFREIKHFRQTGMPAPAPTVEERVAVCRMHLSGALRFNGPIQGLNEMRGRYAHYLKGLPGIHEYTRRLVRLPDAGGVGELLQEIEAEYRGYVTEPEPIRLVDYHSNCSL
ncbi:tRNA dihydrouridine synthase DusB [Puia sp.]|jgi:nifR3 family TIM-barrel protein|uniref:tRNA dihydrouridine synthase DusB n=1 Tax=Puia sp. TaxID=2045100 RepID=UPI002F3E8798